VFGGCLLSEDPRVRKCLTYLSSFKTPCSQVCPCVCVVCKPIGLPLILLLLCCRWQQKRQHPDVCSTYEDSPAVSLILHACDLTNSYDIVDRHPKNIINQDSNLY
jgi:hypothetical protein